MTELSAKQNTVAAKIFLNTFGYVLDESIKYLTFYIKPKIYNKEGKDIGELYFRGNVAYIVVNDGDIKLMASYKLPKVAYGCWDNRISFSLNNSGNQIDGNYIIKCSCSIETNINCTCSVDLTCKTKNGDEHKMEIFSNGSFFRVCSFNGDRKEDINVNVWNEWDPCYYTHRITKGIMDSTGNYPYYSNVILGSQLEKDDSEENLIFVSEKKEYSNIIEQHQVTCIKNPGDTDSDKLIRIGNNMRCFDPKLFDQIYMLQEPMMIGKTSVLQNIISICLDKYPNNIVYAMLGIRKIDTFYQDNVCNLKDAYFGTPEKSEFAKILKNFK